jgi:hypothetical protein
LSRTHHTVQNTSSAYNKVSVDAFQTSKQTSRKHQLFTRWIMATCCSNHSSMAMRATDLPMNPQQPNPQDPLEKSFPSDDLIFKNNHGQLIYHHCVLHLNISNEISLLLHIYICLSLALHLQLFPLAQARKPKLAADTQMCHASQLHALGYGHQADSGPSPNHGLVAQVLKNQHETRCDQRRHHHCSACN